jgi:AcrR family transcriptional regulator
MPKAFSEYEKELIGKKLLEQGYRLFSAYGLKKTNIEEIAQAAGISKGAFYSFYESKEALFMDVIEEAEIRVRRELLAVIDQPGPTSRSRLLAVLKKAFELFEAIPILKFLTGSDYDLIFRRIPAEKLEEHLSNDQVFIVELVDRCRKVGIPIQVPPEQVIGLLYPLVLTMIHQDVGVLENFNGSIDVLLELVAAYCLGEIKIQPSESETAPSGSEEGSKK